jgi:hypothetical protein
MIKAMVRKMMKATPAWRRGAWAAALLALSGSAAGCADHVQSAVVACPCDTGVCCTSGVCAPSDNACEAATQALSSESAGHWTGYIEGLSNAELGSDALELTLEVDGSGALLGRLIVGSGPAPAPPTDGAVVWPPGAADPLTATFSPVLGFAYHISNATWTALRLRFDVAMGEALAPWCHLQQPYPTSDNPPGWRCAPDTVQIDGGPPCYFDVQTQQTADCGWIEMCLNQTCDCNASGCEENLRNGLHLDVALHGDQGDGTVSPVGSAAINTANIRLIRASH